LGGSNVSDVHRHRYGRHALDAGAIAAVLGYSVVLNRALPRRVHIPGNLVAAGCATLAARAAGASWDDLGYGVAHVPRGVRDGIAVALPIAAGIAGAALFPPTSRQFAGRHVDTGSHPAFEVAVRIPIGTALCEEVIFRGALLAWFERHRSARAATVLSSMCFGLWHILPTLDARAATGDGAAPEPAPAAVALTVAVTTAAGAAFVGLRRRSGSVVAPLLAHAALNGAAFIAGYRARRVPSSRDRT
jgi:uncharacterized protein